MAEDNISLDLLRHQLEQTRAKSDHLSTGGGGGTYGGMDTVDAKIAASEARTDTKFAELRGDLKAIQHSTSGVRATVIGTGLAAVALVVGIFAWGSQMFGTGMDAQTIADRSAQQVQVATEERMARIEVHLELIAQQLREQQAANAAPEPTQTP